MQKFNVKIQGITPYMQHRMDDIKLADWEKNRKQIIERPDVAKEDAVRAEYHCYRNGKGKCFIPADHLKGAIIGGGGMVKSKVGNAKRSMKNICAAMFFIEQDQVLIPDYDAVDKRSAVNKNVKARVIVVRPKWMDWSAEFTLLVDNDTITKDTVREILEQSGQFIGIGSFRPTNNGSFGRYSIAKLEPIKSGKAA